MTSSVSGVGGGDTEKQVEENRGRGLTKCYFTQNVTHELLIQILNTKLSIREKCV